MSAGAANITSVRFGDSVPSTVPDSPQIARERESARDDFVALASLVPLRNGEAVLGDGPFALTLESAGTSLALVFTRLDDTGGNAGGNGSVNDPGAPQQFVVSMSLSPLRRLLRDYARIVESYYDAIRTGQAARIEAVDMARRGLHNEAAEVLIERLDGKIRLDIDSARGLFTLVNAIRYDGRGGLR